MQPSALGDRLKDFKISGECVLNQIGLILVWIAVGVAVIAPVVLIRRRIDSSMHSRKRYNDILLHRSSPTLAYWSIDTVCGIPLATFLECLRKELGWPLATFLPTDMCSDVFNSNDGYGFGVSDLLLELRRGSGVIISSEELVQLIAPGRTLGEFVEMINQRYCG